MTQGEESLPQAQEAPQEAAVWAAVSHEIRTPLMGVIGMLEILGHTSLTEEQRRIIATAETSSHSLMRIVDDVIDFARLETTSVTLAPVPTDIGLLAEDCAGFLATQAGPKGLALTCEIDGLLPRVVCDPVRLRQLLVNLGGNAVKFTDHGTVALSVQLTATREREVSLRLSVQDSGIGIPVELRPFLFQPFSRLITGGGERRGAGLGLAICRRIVEIMGGAITVASVPAGAAGSVFHVDLALPIADFSKEDGAKEDGIVLDGFSILAVDGDRTTAIALRYLEDAGAQVTRLRALGEITQRIGAAGPALVVLGPETESEDITAVATALRATPGAPALLWLKPQSGQAAVESIAAYPLRRRELLAAAKRVGDPLAAVAAPVVTRRAPAQMGFAAVREEATAAARAEGRVVLVAEDNPINQDVLCQQLSILGYDCDIADNGAAALKALETGRYLLMLCDCHMPGVDGFELTRRVRAIEGTANAQRLPIIAITANALPGEAARCRAAGMDDYLAKPIEIRTLQAMIERWLPLALQTPAVIPFPPGSGGAAPASGVSPVVDTRNLEAIYGNDPVRLARVLAEWRAGIEEAVRTIADALTTGRPDAALAAAHRIKGSAGIAGAYGLSAEAAALEVALRAGNGAAAKQAAQRVEAVAAAAVSEIAGAVHRAKAAAS